MHNRSINWPPVDGRLMHVWNSGFEFDQRMLDALRLASPVGTDFAMLNDAHIALALTQLNPRGCSDLPFRPGSGVNLRYIPDGDPVPIERLSAGTVLQRLLDLACERFVSGNTIGAVHFLQAIVQNAFDYGDDPTKRGYAMETLIEAHGGKPNQPLSHFPQVKRLLRRLGGSPDGTDDYQYTLLLEGDAIRFRVISTLDDYVQEDHGGVWTPYRALLTHIGKIGLFTYDEVGELEDLINNAKVTEADLQAFFERHPHFLRRWDHREIHPHVYLTREADGPLIPDFILTNRETQDAAILELKRPVPRSPLVRSEKNRRRFSDAVMAARAQLLEYGEWFDIPGNRQRLKGKVGMEIYRPRLLVLIGRTREFQDELDRQRLRDRNPGFELVTYDDILAHARHRMALVEPAHTRLYEWKRRGLLP